MIRQVVSVIVTIVLSFLLGLLFSGDFINALREYGNSAAWNISNPVSATWLALTAHTVFISVGEYKGFFIVSISTYINAMINRKISMTVVSMILVIIIMYGVEFSILIDLPESVANAILANSAIDILSIVGVSVLMGFVAELFMKSIA